MSPFELKPRASTNNASISNTFLAHSSSRTYDNPSIRWYSHSALNFDNITDNDVCSWDLFPDAVSDYVADFWEEVFEAPNHLESHKSRFL